MELFEYESYISWYEYIEASAENRGNIKGVCQDEKGNTIIIVEVDGEYCWTIERMK